MNTQELITTREAAENLGYTIQHTRLLIRRGQIEATKFGRDWLVVRESVVEYKTSGVKGAGGDTNE
ncbi:MAG: helix-turn-helix domain-containing protein [Gemmatimonadota bacterium]|nr:helix-turn-helix domain-containing protein [Gemmatimonadota bacterium]MXX12537.1 helix-turn-helix domain-containing protein [Gemmatimonadota bacterium]MYB59335.1 helix-turn-helix domain-containing protein [Gemmatimonadota bacterium]MYD63334.1 helix-turn-helix domain-containing protein [Gemmatimonadota bacterium]